MSILSMQFIHLPILGDILLRDDLQICEGTGLHEDWLAAMNSWRGIPWLPHNASIQFS